MLVRHLKNHSSKPQKYIRVKLPVHAAHNSFHWKIVGERSKRWQRLREWNTPTRMV